MPTFTVQVFKIGEFSDDAYYMCPYTQELFFRWD